MGCSTGARKHLLFLRDNFVLIASCRVQNLCRPAARCLLNLDNSAQRPDRARERKADLLRACVARQFFPLKSLFVPAEWSAAVVVWDDYSNKGFLSPRKPGIVS